jgi:predicted ribosome quality control (RQC) complex YloA/Tae2 family protein
MKFRQFTTSSKKLVLCGKSAETNEELLKTSIKPDEIVLHTKAPGSPFCVIKGKATKKDINETAVFCASYSKAWKQNKSNVEVHYFKGNDIYKEKGMKSGTFGVRKARKIIAKKKDILDFLKLIK